ncbi:MAG: SDR family oxidoreductase [Gemmatimonadales bacterium]|nr:SDR family oxidoreductase [Gemmatimonadales bacterium]MYG18053.1 SDR family oxidoreductase [Gemmatimonadales bacterium]MYH09763.1 SDR family oxidoreductase [Gemmatimonadales bacterium]MYL07794.1 SDR family oxidoreductase [Gemmatimonadales bacterium]
MTFTVPGLPGLAGKRVLVTGGSRGIGRAAVRCLAASGASVGVAYHRAEAEGRSAVEEAYSLAPDGRHWCAGADLADPAECRTLFERADAEFGGLDGFVGNAGIWNVDARPLESLEADEWRRMIETNLTSIYASTREAALRLRADGRIVLVSSTASQRGEAEHSHYAASKGAINAFCKSVATELGPRSINVNAVAPGWVDTDMSSPALQGEAGQAALALIPLGRVATAEDIAGPICFLLSDAARHITGEILNVNGGSVLCG